MTVCGAKPIEWTTPSRLSRPAPRTASARPSRSSWFVTSSCTTGASTGRRLLKAAVSLAWRPKEDSTTCAPSCWARRAAWNAMEESVSTPVMRSFLPSRRPMAGLSSGGKGKSSVAHAEAAVDRDHSARDVRRGVGGEERDHAGDLVDLPEAAGGDRGLVGLLRLLGE